MGNYFVIQNEERNGDEGYYQGICKGLMKIYCNYIGFDHLFSFNGLRKLTLYIYCSNPVILYYDNNGILKKFHLIW